MQILGKTQFLKVLLSLPSHAAPVGLCYQEEPSLSHPHPTPISIGQQFSAKQTWRPRTMDEPVLPRDRRSLFLETIWRSKGRRYKRRAMKTVAAFGSLRLQCNKCR